MSQLGNQTVFDTSPDGATPLHFAACKHDYNYSDCLLSLLFVCFAMVQTTLNMLLERYSFIATAASGQVTTARWLLNCDLSGTLICSKDKNGDTAAHDAAESG